MWRHLLILSCLCGIATCLLGMVSLSGYIIGYRVLYQWFGVTPMAPNTAVCFILAGMAIGMLSAAGFVKEKTTNS